MILSLQVDTAAAAAAAVDTVTTATMVAARGMEEARVARAVTAVRGRAAGEIPKYHTGCVTPADRTTAVAVGGRLSTTSSPVTPVLSVLL
jgi:hypothetical protein